MGDYFVRKKLFPPEKKGWGLKDSALGASDCSWKNPAKVLWQEHARSPTYNGCMASISLSPGAKVLKLVLSCSMICVNQMHGGSARTKMHKVQHTMGARQQSLEVRNTMGSWPCNLHFGLSPREWRAIPDPRSPRTLHSHLKRPSVPRPQTHWITNWKLTNLSCSMIWVCIWSKCFFLCNICSMIWVCIWRKCLCLASPQCIKTSVSCRKIWVCIWTNCLHCSAGYHWLLFNNNVYCCRTLLPAG